MQEKPVKRSGFPHERVRKQEVQAKKYFPIGGKRQHTSQSQNYMANHVIWLLRAGGKIWKGRGGKVKAAVPVREAATEIASLESWEICDI